MSSQQSMRTCTYGAVTIRSPAPANSSDPPRVGFARSVQYRPDIEYIHLTSPAALHAGYRKRESRLTCSSSMLPGPPRLAPLQPSGRGTALTSFRQRSADNRRSAKVYSYSDCRSAISITWATMAIRPSPKHALTPGPPSSVRSSLLSLVSEQERTRP